jgi:hypothetical protein
MEKLTIKFNKKPKSLKNKKKVVSYLERHNIDYNFKTIPLYKKTECNKCGTIDYENFDCDECIKNTVGEVYYM